MELRMEQKTKTAVCPCCGGTLQVQGQALFKEHHERLWKEKIAECGIPQSAKIRFGDLFYNKHDGYSINCVSRYTVVNKPEELVQWERGNPIPEIDLIDFVANLAQKGGLQ